MKRTEIIRKRGLSLLLAGFLFCSGMPFTAQNVSAEENPGTREFAGEESSQENGDGFFSADISSDANESFDTNESFDVNQSPDEMEEEKCSTILQ